MDRGGRLQFESQPRKYVENAFQIRTVVRKKWTTLPILVGGIKLSIDKWPTSLFALLPVSYVGELLVFYTEIQKSFTDRLKEFTNQFEMILEGEKLVSGAKNQLEVANEKENRIRKEVNRASKRRDSGSSDLRDWTEKLVQAQREKDMVKLTTDSSGSPSRTKY